MMLRGMPKNFASRSKSRKNGIWHDPTDVRDFFVLPHKTYKRNEYLSRSSSSSSVSAMGTSQGAPSKSTRLTARNDKQREYLRMLHDPLPHIVIATGSAGTGKTMLATHVGVLKLLNDDIKKIIITRPAVSVDEAHGFLPGTLEKKMEPWLRPVFDALGIHFPRNKVEAMVKDKIIEMCPLAYMRGRTFENAWIICDEAQNTTPNQMLMVLTRIGKGSKLVITGDPNQYDRGYDKNGLTDLIQRVSYHDCDEKIKIVEFTDADVERHEVIPLVLNMYNSI